MESKTSAGFGIGLVTGVIIGGVIALLHALKPGKETRQLIKDKSTEVVDTLKEKTSGVMNTVKEATSEASRKGQVAVKALKS
ncbi:MAG: YtxH domain-containing protein [Chloroflexota bacterium]